MKIINWPLLGLRAVHNINKYQIAEKLERMSRTGKVIQLLENHDGNDNGIVTKQKV